MVDVNRLSRFKGVVWDVLRSPKTIALIKVGVAVVGVIHAIEELRGTPRKKTSIGFKFNDD